MPAPAQSCCEQCTVTHFHSSTAQQIPCGSIMQQWAVCHDRLSLENDRSRSGLDPTVRLLNAPYLCIWLEAMSVSAAVGLITTQTMKGDSRTSLHAE